MQQEECYLEHSQQNTLFSDLLTFPPGWFWTHFIALEALNDKSNLRSYELTPLFDYFLESCSILPTISPKPIETLVGGGLK